MPSYTSADGLANDSVGPIALHVDSGNTCFGTQRDGISCVDADGRWHHIVVVRDYADSEITLYLEGGGEVTVHADVVTNIVPNEIVKDEGEQWEVMTPNLQGADSAHDLKAVRGMIDAGSGFPAHYRGEAEDANLATATAMQAPTERRLLRRQKYFVFLLMDIVYNAYQRSQVIGKVP